MKNAPIPRMTKAWLACFVLCFCAISKGSDERPICLAVVAEGEAAGFGDALVATLGTDSNVQFVERSKLDELATEAALGNLSAEKRPVALARLAKADGLVFAAVNKGDAQTKASLLLRMVATGDGRVVGGLVLPWIPSEVETNARLAAARAKSWLPQLHAGLAGSRVAITLLGIRAVRDGSDTRPFELTLNTLLAHWLAGETGVSLLERWRTDELVFEQTLEAKNAPPLSAAVRLIDGSFDIKSTGAVEVRLRQRTSGEKEGTIDSVTGRADRIHELVSKIVSSLRMGDALAPSTLPGNPVYEVQTYTELASWLLEHEMAREAVEAFESAVALGDASRNTLKGRARAWGLAAYPIRNEKHLFYGNFNNYSPRYKLSAEALPAHLTSAVRALDSALASGDFTEICLELRSAFWVISAVHELRAHVKLSAQVDRLRTALRDFISRADQLENGAPEYFRLFYALLKADFAAYWCASPQETLAYYDQVLSPEYAKTVRLRYPSGWEIPLRDSLVNRPCLHGPLLGTGMIASSSGLELEICQARLIDWTREDDRYATDLWKEYLAKLRGSHGLRGPIDGMSFAFRSSSDPSSRVALLREMLEFLSKNRTALCQTEGRSLLATLPFKPGMLFSRGPGSDEVFRGFLRLQQELFESGEWVPIEWVDFLDQLEGPIARETLSAPEVQAFICALGNYEAWASKNPRWNERSGGRGAGRGVDTYREEFFFKRNSLTAAWPRAEVSVAAKGNPDTLVISRFVETRPGRILEQIKFDCGIRDGILETHGEEVWAMDDQLGVVAFHPAGGRITAFGRPPVHVPVELECFVPTADAIWVAGPTGVWCCQRNDKRWIQPEFPLTYSFVRACGPDVYAAYGCTNKRVDNIREAGAGVARMTSNGPEWVFSTRRRPAQHPLDTIEIMNLTAIFPGPRGVPMVSLWEQGVGKYPAVYDLGHNGERWFEIGCISMADQVIPCGEQTLLWNGSILAIRDLPRGEAWRISPKLEQPELLLARPNPSAPATMEPKWKVGDVFLAPEGSRNWLCPFLYGDELWVLQWRTTPESGRGAGILELTGFLPDRQAPVRIPLGLKLPEQFAHVPSGGAPEESRLFKTLHPSVPRRGTVATSYGVVICGIGSRGFWVLPWAEIRAWIAAHPNAKVGP